MASHIAGLYHLGGGGVHTAVIDADYASDISHPTFPDYPVTVPKIGPSVPKDPPQRFCSQDIEPFLQLTGQRT